MHLKLALGLVLACVAGPVKADIVETFDAGANGWSVVAYPFRSHVANPAMTPAPFDAAFGNPAGSLRVGDVYSETAVAAPAPYLGDQSACYGHTLAYDIYIRYVDAGAIYPAVVLNGGALSVYYDTPTPTVGVWESRVVPLTETGWRLSSSGALVDEATFRSVLADLHGLYIYTEWHTGGDDTSFDNVRLAGTTIGIDDEIPAMVALRPCTPNPFNPLTTIRFALATAAPVRLQVLSTDGRVVRTLLAETRDAGAHAVLWDGRDAAGRQVASGTYVCRLEAGSVVRTTRMTLVK